MRPGAGLRPEHIHPRDQRDHRVRRHAANPVQRPRITVRRRNDSRIKPRLRATIRHQSGKASRTVSQARLHAAAIAAGRARWGSGPDRRCPVAWTSESETIRRQAGRRCPVRLGRGEDATPCRPTRPGPGEDDGRSSRRRQGQTQAQPCGEARSSAGIPHPCSMATWAGPPCCKPPAPRRSTRWPRPPTRRGPNPGPPAAGRRRRTRPMAGPARPVSHRSVPSAAIPTSTTASASVVARANDTLLPQRRSRLTASVSRKSSVRPSRSPANAAAATAKPYRHAHPMAIAPSAPFRASPPKYRNASHCPATAISATNTQMRPEYPRFLPPESSDHGRGTPGHRLRHM